MTKKVSKAEKLDFLVREIGKIKKQLKLLSVQHENIAESLAKLTRQESRKSSGSAPAKSAAAKTSAAKSGPQSKPAPASRRVSTAPQEAEPAPAKLVA